MIDLRGVTKSFGDVIPIKDVSIRLQDGEFVSIVGPSGSGKSTLLNLMAGLLTPNSGEIIIDGTSLYKLPQRDRVAFRRKHFGFVFQTFNLIPYLTAIENVEIPLYLIGVEKHKQGIMAGELMDRVGLMDKYDRFPTQLSTGEQQRVAIARALANNPRVIFADEPTGNLDKKTGEEVMGFMKELNAGGVTVLVVTHDLEIAEYAWSKVKLDDGRLTK